MRVLHPSLTAAADDRSGSVGSRSVCSRWAAAGQAARGVGSGTAGTASCSRVAAAAASVGSAHSERRSRSRWEGGGHGRGSEAPKSSYAAGPQGLLLKNPASEQQHLTRCQTMLIEPTGGSTKTPQHAAGCKLLRRGIGNSSRNGRGPVRCAGRLARRPLACCSTCNGAAGAAAADVMHR